MPNSHGAFTLKAGMRIIKRGSHLNLAVTVDRLIEGEKNYGKGVDTATCDGPLFAGKDVAVMLIPTKVLRITF